MKTLAIVLVHYHTPELLAGAIRALRTDVGSSGLEAELIVVDNGSTADERLLVDHLPARIIRPDRNLGYAGGANRGLSGTSADALIVMNPDVEVLPGCVRSLVDVLDAGFAAAGPRLYWDEGKRVVLPPTEAIGWRPALLKRLAESSPAWEHRARREWRRHAWLYWRARSPISGRALSGAMLAISREAWRQVGVFDEGYRLYFEETDWLLRMGECGLRSCFVPAAEALHRYDQSAAHEPAAGRWLGESAARFERRAYGVWFPRMLRWIPARRQSRRSVRGPIAQAPPVVSLGGLPEGAAAPVWIEVSPCALGFPAAAAWLGPSPGPEWTFPSDLWQRLGPGGYVLRVVDDTGRELAEHRFERAAAGKGL